MDNLDKEIVYFTNESINEAIYDSTPFVLYGGEESEINFVANLGLVHGLLIGDITFRVLVGLEKKNNRINWTPAKEQHIRQLIQQTILKRFNELEQFVKTYLKK